MSNFEHKIEKLTEIYSRRIRNKRTTKGLIMASSDDSYLKLKRDENGNIKESVDDIILEQVENERKSGNFFLNHLILRDSTAEILNDKSLYFIGGVPVIVWVLMNLTKSELEKIGDVGSKYIKLVTDAFIDLYKQEITFGDEGEEWSIGNTLSKGKDILNPNNNELAYISPADVPFLYDINKIIRNRYRKKYEAVLNMNVKEKVGRYFPRNYHLKVGRFDAKEPNVFLADLNKVPCNVITILYSGFRKHYIKKKPKPPLTKKEFLRYAWEYKNEPAVRRIVPKLICKLDGIGWNIKLFSKLINITRIFDRDIPRISRSSFQDVLCLLSNMKIKVLTTNNDPATLEDLDSYEDWCYMNQMIKAGSNIYPYYDEIQKFKQVMPELRRKIPLLENFEEYINSIFKKFGLFEKPYYKDGAFFLLKEPFNLRNELDLDFAKLEVIKMIKNNINFHRDYLRKYKRRQLFRKEYK